MTALNTFLRTVIGAVAFLSLAIATPALADKSVVWDGSEPAPGIWFYWYEPSFYAGFAPKTQDPSRVHMQLSRGNQQRFTLVLGAAEVDNYLDDLALRRATIQNLVDKGIIELTTNRAFERFAAQLDEAGVTDALAARDGQSPDEFRQRSVEIMEALNPGRIFRIVMPLDRVLADWHARLAALDLSTETGQLDAANALLPGRINAYQLSDENAALLQAAAAAAAGGADSAEFHDATVAFLEAVTDGHYPVFDDRIVALEFTAIYPVGTAQAFTNTDYGKLPDFGVHGVWPLVERAKGRGITGMVDYLSSNPGYGFIPLIAYQPAGGVYYNAIHNAGIRTPAGTPYLPKEWRGVPGELKDEPYQQLWLVSRGPASHGCTRMDSGQMSEFRNSMPSTSDGLSGIPNFRGLPQCHEVFDVDGNGTEEVMGVAYFHAYKSAKHEPAYAYAPNNRDDYYAWLYGDNVAYNDDGSAVIKTVPICRFHGLKKAQEAAVLENIPLYEAPFEPGPIQFYQLKPTSFESRPGMEFNRELRRVGIGYEPNNATLFLE